GSQQAARNTNDGVSMLQTAEGGLHEASGNLHRMRDLAVQSANATNAPSDREALQVEFAELQGEITRTIESTDFNGNKVLNESQNLEFQTGPNADPATNKTIVSTSNVLADSDVSTAVNTSEITTQAASGAAITEIDAALDKINMERARLGASQNRMESTVRNLETSAESQSASRSRIEDADYAKETSNLARDIILNKAGIAALSHANVNSKLVSGLLNKQM
ncbi:MAG: flagellin, partial [Gammaproteobacteria bacterium]|nr:flagellin [Gammaproteobacteria bacterium]